MFKGWLKPFAGKETKAFCHCCNVQMASEMTVLRNHAKGTRHMEKVKSLASNQVSIVQCLQQSNEKEKLETAVRTAGWVFSQTQYCYELSGRFGGCNKRLFQRL